MKNIRELYKKDKELKDDKDTPNNTFARVEIHPKNGDYLKPDTWEYVIDENVRPSWINNTHEKIAWSAWKNWKKEIYTFNVKEALHPIHPFLIPAKTVTKKDKENLKEWASVWDLVRASVWDSVGDSVWDFGQGFGLGFGLGFGQGFGLGFGQGFGRGFGQGLYWCTISTYKNMEIY